MKKVYFDASETKKCVGIIVADAEVIQAGTTVCSMSVNQKNETYARFAKAYDIHFIFDDAIPKLDFYTVPRVDIMAADSHGGWIGTLFRQSDLESDAPICYIDNQRSCYCIAANGADFLQKAADWRAHLAPCPGVVFYPSKAAAERELDFVDMSQFA